MTRHTIDSSAATARRWPSMAALASVVLCASVWTLGPATAADALAPCCADLEERIAELEALSARKGTRKVSLTISGLVSNTLMAWDDGRERDIFLVSNEIRRPRFRFAGDAKIAADWSAGFAIEIGPNPSPFAPMDQFAYDPSSGLHELRWSYLWLKNAGLGQVSLGQQTQATDSVTESSVVNIASGMSPGLPIMMGYIERGWFMRRDSDNVLTGLRFGDVMFHGRNDIWGEGHRWNIVRYDTPSFNGVTLSASWGEDDTKDAAIRYTGEGLGFKLAAAAGIAAWTDGRPGNQRGCAKPKATPDLDCWEIGGSASLLHVASGLFINAATGFGRDNNMKTLYGGRDVDDTATFAYLVGGIEQPWLSVGKTTLFSHYWHKSSGAGLTFRGDVLDATPLGANAFIAGTDVTIVGVGINQELGAGIDLYASYSHAETEIATSATGTKAGAATTDIAPFQFIIAGMAVRF
ncbi:MAG: porin [Hyphomicrobium sp.]